jgi:hypothetical protein
LNECLKAVPSLAFPQLHFLTESIGDKQEKQQSISSKDPKKIGQKRKTKISKKGKEGVKAAKSPHAVDGNTQDPQRSQQGQPAGAPANTAEAVPNAGTTIDGSKEIVHWTNALVEEQRWKFRALTLTCTAILSIPEVGLGILIVTVSFIL